MPTRRALLLGTAGATIAGAVGAGVGVEKDVLPGRTFAYEHLGLNGEDGDVPDTDPGRVDTGSFRSAARGGVETATRSFSLPPTRTRCCRSSWPCTGSGRTRPR